MSKAKHTPGPWGIIPANAGEPNSDILACPPRDDEGVIVASVCNTADTEGEANARLIAAAPELLEACEALHSILLQFVDYQSGPWCAKALAAIKKAKGE